MFPETAVEVNYVPARDSIAIKHYARQLVRQYSPQRKMLLIQAPQFLFESINLDVARNRGYYVYPPTGLQCLKKALSDRNLDVEIFDLNFQLLHRMIYDPAFDYHDWLRLLDVQLEKSEPSIVGVSCLTVYADMFTTCHPLTEILRHLMGKQQYIALAGGPTATNEIQRILENGLCHFVIEGEGEDRLNYLLDVLFDEPADRRPTAGIYFRYNGSTQQTDGDKENVALKGNLISTYPEIPTEDYHTVGSLNPYSRMVGQDRIYGVLLLNRGCRWNCKFCGVRAFMGRGVRTSPVAELIEEARYLVTDRGVRHFEILDDDFLANPPAFKRLLAALCQMHKDYGISWSANNGLPAASLTEELLALMKDSGCLGFKVGIESGNEEMLRKMRKPGTLALFKDTAIRINRYPSLFVGGNYIIGLFGEETFGQMLDTFLLSRELNFDWSSFTVFQMTSRPNAEAEHLKFDGAGATDFIPAKDTSSRDIGEERSLPLGPDVFGLPGDLIPTRGQMRNIWLTFNVVGNYIFNKHLQRGGCPEKVVAWIEAVQVAYPTNPYMHLFAGLGQALRGQEIAAEDHFRKCETIVSASEIWSHRFKKFHLDTLMHPCPLQAATVFERLQAIQGLYRAHKVFA